MAKLVLASTLMFGPVLYWGAVGRGWQTAVLWATLMAALAVATGWRAQDQGVVGSMLHCLGLTLRSCVPIYFLAAVATAVLLKGSPW